MAFVQATKASAAATDPLVSTGITTTAGNLMVVAVTTAGGGTLAGLTDSKSNTWIALANSNIFINSIERLYVYYAKNILGGASHTVTADLSGAVPSAMSIIELSGRDTTTPLVASVMSNSTLGGVKTNTHVSTSIGVMAMTNSDLVCMAGDTAISDAGFNISYTNDDTAWTMPAAGTVDTAATTTTVMQFYRTNVDPNGVYRAAWDTIGSGVTEFSASITMVFRASGATSVLARLSAQGDTRLQQVLEQGDGDFPSQLNIKAWW